jgi:amidase
VDNLHYRSLAEVGRLVKSGATSAVDVTSALLERIRRLEPELHSYARVLEDQALATAARLDRDRSAGKPLGSLHGVPVAVKDLLDTRGVVTASGTRVMASRVPDEDATVVARLKQAGAVIIGKTQLTEGAFATHHPDIEAPVNPWNAAHWTGVSSSGSGVAVAAGLAYGALGSDTGGSIRFPSACCGIVGIKPTYGRVSRHGAFPLAESLDHIGPMARTVEDAALLLQAIAGSDPADPTSLSSPPPSYAAMLAERLPGLVIGVDWDYVSRGVEEPVVDTVREALGVFRSLGAREVEVAMPPETAALIEGWVVTCAVECARAHRRYYPAQKERYGPVLAALIERGLGTPVPRQSRSRARARGPADCPVHAHAAAVTRCDRRVGRNGNVRRSDRVHRAVRLLGTSDPDAARRPHARARAQGVPAGRAPSGGACARACRVGVREGERMVRASAPLRGGCRRSTRI